MIGMKIFLAAVAVIGVLVLAGALMGTLPAMAHAVKDALTYKSRALPNGAATVTMAAGIDTGKSTTQGHQPGNVEYLLTAPALTTAQLADAQTMKYDILFSATEALGSPTVYITAAITQTGAGGAGAAAQTFRFRAPSDGLRYVGARATKSGAGDASGATFTLEATY